MRVMVVASRSPARALALAEIDVTAVVSGSSGSSGTRDHRAWSSVAARVDRACRTTGFFTIVGHGVPDDLRRDALRTADQLFALPPTVKDALRTDCPPGVQRGYSGIGGEAQAHAAGGATRPDLSESFAIGSPPRPEHGPYAAPNVWPPIDGFEAVWTEYRRVMERLAADLLAVCALALEGDATAYAHLVRHPIGSTRANHYPALDADVADDQWRGGAHTDYGTLTILATDGVPGLEIRTAGGTWQPVDAPAGGFVVNVGDLLARLSRGRWRSTWHRVTTPPGPPPYPARTSIAHFQFPDHDAVIPSGHQPSTTSDPGSGRTRPEPLGRASVTAGDYLTGKLAQLVDVDDDDEPSGGSR